MSEGPDEDLRALVERALALADAQGLTGVAIGLDQARVALGKADGSGFDDPADIDRLLGSAA